MAGPIQTKLVLTGRTETVAALFVHRGTGAYTDLSVDPWDEGRDARDYHGPLPVIAHPPCSSWCQLAYINQKRYGHKVGDDGGCFVSALESVRRWGGVLEHPAFPHAWPAFNLPRPVVGQWKSEGVSWVTQVSQSAYGCPARKRTWLYYVGKRAPFDVNWTETTPTHQIGRAHV